MRHLLLAVTLAFVACSLNPQPLPPEQPTDGANDAGAGNSDGSAFNGADSGSGGSNPDASVSVPDGGAVDASDGGDGGDAGPRDADSDGG